MTEDEAFERLASFGLSIEPLKAEFRKHGFCVYQGDGFKPTFFWHDGMQWIWQPKLVVPGPGPLLQFDALEDLVQAVVAQ